ncbi:prolipoprotein diacylglyceryl transferase [Xylanimonas oleitrophica]|uniref:Phosphatidylglycerol--prolipoprotein diacylglyceryl transferase n=1 Tax=Xylanimonas oleitrophica TaxID=2607479 RepID=A0A2W5WTV4_9MICO|nr:prolipoprotein diacylglyceryl transferase family protein [Xylanimonas oleitrophica]PZR51666.1 prolipoprotein diacylglyceryl transferase [Xylanimonas oleitrophica]
MRPVLASLLGVDVQSYGVSKALAALVAAWLLGRAFSRLGLDKDDAHSLVLWATIFGFAGGKVYFLLEHLDELSWHHLGGAGFTWYGGLIAGVATALVFIRRRHLPAAAVADAAAVPLALAYGIGRLGCWLAGDGTYGRPTDLPWGMALPDALVPTDVRVHPTPLYEALAAAVIALLLWARARRRRPPLQVFGSYLVLAGLARLGVEFFRINEQSLFGLTQPQLWSLLSLTFGVVLIARGLAPRRAPGADGTAPVPDAHREKSGV